MMNRLTRCARRVLRAEQLMRALLLAWDTSEKAQVEAALERIRLFLAGV